MTLELAYFAGQLFSLVFGDMAVDEFLVTLGPLPQDASTENPHTQIEPDKNVEARDLRAHLAIPVLVMNRRTKLTPMTIEA